MLVRGRVAVRLPASGAPSRRTAGLGQAPRLLRVESVQRYSAVRDDALGDLDLVGVQQALAAGQVSGDELTAAALQRAHEANEVLNAVVYWIDPPLQPGPDAPPAPFAGVPSFIKDNEDLAGTPTTHGSRAVPRTIRAETSDFISQYAELGFTVLGKTALPEFGLTASTESLVNGPTRNPWDLSRTPGGSSGGSAALVAAGVVPIAHANDGGGSIRIPAACCGLVGLKPTRHRLVLPVDSKNLPVKIATQGVLTRTVRDTIAYFHEQESRFPTLEAIGHIDGPSTRRLRIAVCVGGVGGLPVAADVAAATLDAGLACERLGHDVEEIPMPFGHGLGRDFLRYWAALAFMLKAGGKSLFGPDFDPSQLEPLTLGLAQFFGTIAERVPASIYRLRQFQTEYEALFENFDVLITPVLGRQPPHIGTLSPSKSFHEHMVEVLRFASFTAVQNVSGAPAISLPLSRTDDGVPLGVQLASANGHDRTLLELSLALEESVGWPTQIPVEQPAAE